MDERGGERRGDGGAGGRERWRGEERGREGEREEGL